jgi:hypothetical protein
MGIQDAGATGLITDAVTGKPIEGATVYAAWYYHPWHLPIPVETQQAQIACGGTAVVKTDANGEYELGIWMDAQIHLHDAHFWVTAPGYYDNYKQQLPRGLDKYRDVLATVIWNPASGKASWSRTLTPLGDASIDAKLLAIEASGGDADSCVAGIVEPFRAETEYHAALKSAMRAALCDGDRLEAPRTDVFETIFRAESGDGFEWKYLVSALLPAQDTQSVPDLALRNACSLMETKVGHASRFGPPALRIAVQDAVSGEPLGHVPVRILWGAADPEEGTGKHQISNVMIKRGFVATTSDAGFIELPITQEMLAEQHLGPMDRYPQLHYAAIPLVSDRVSFAPHPQELPVVCDARDLLYFAVPADLRGNVSIMSSHCLSRQVRSPLPKWLPRVPQEGAQDRAAGGGAVRKVTGETASTQSPVLDPSVAPEYVELARIIQEENVRRTDDPVRAVNRAIVNLYAWQWPSAALLGRAYQLIVVQPDIEADPDILLEVQRQQVSQAFDTLCAQPDNTEVRDPIEVTRELWWIETQTKGLVAANAGAQDRSVAWDNGSRCKYKDGQMIALGGTQPPNPLMKGTVCKVWDADRAAFASSPTGKPPALETFAVDYSTRVGACVNQPRNGASL